jgi:hypothetical protein
MSFVAGTPGQPRPFDVLVAASSSDRAEFAHDQPLETPS